MPDNRQSQNPSNAVTSSSSAPPENLEDAIWRLNIQDNQEGGDANRNPYPDRPGEPDCSYYMRTGLCGYGSNCRYNHPVHFGQVSSQRELDSLIASVPARGDGAVVAYNLVEMVEMLGLKSAVVIFSVSSCCMCHAVKQLFCGMGVNPMVYELDEDPHGRDIERALMRLLGDPHRPRSLHWRQAGPRHGPGHGLPHKRHSYFILHFYLQYFLKTGTCKFGATCKYHHPRDRLPAMHVMLNMLGLPMRPEEKSCPYYLRTGSCKFGFACKFHHPEPALGAVLPETRPSMYESSGSAVASPSGPPFISGVSSWALPRHPYVSTPHMHGLSAFVPVVIPSSQSTVPTQQGWSTYT
ncbi:hypothetical protein Taro_042999, partial [Colocasia esculenta]|nr:hypothetical protein [Colocasia esculenta]